MTTRTALLTYGAALAIALTSAACGSKKPADGPAENAGEKIDDAAKDTKEGAKKAAEETKEGAKKVGDDVEKKTDKK